MQSAIQITAENQEDELPLDNDDFYLVNSDDIVEEEINYSLYPWLNPTHPLFFPTHQSISEKTRWEAVNQFSIENWYSFLEKHTFKSYFLNLDYDDIHFLMDKALPGYQSSKLIEALNKILLNFNHHEAFMRLSTRSPKDSASLFKEAAHIMSQDNVNWPDLENQNQQLIAFVSSMLSTMKMQDGLRIIETIKQSSRVLNDFMALIFSTKPIECNTQIILREWQDIHPSDEFRVFVSRRNRKDSIVTAIEPYFHFLHYGSMNPKSLNFSDETIQKILTSKLQEYILQRVDPDIAAFLNFKDEQEQDDSSDCIREYVIDIAVIPEENYHGPISEDKRLLINDKNYVMVVIELNPFAPAATGSGLFNWQEELMLLWGKAACDYPVFRYRSTPREDLKGVTLLPANYESVIADAIEIRKHNVGLGLSKQSLFHCKPETSDNTNSHTLDI